LINVDEAVVDTGIVGKIIPLLSSIDDGVQLAALRVIACIAQGDHGHIQVNNNHDSKCNSLGTYSM